MVLVNEYSNDLIRCFTLKLFNNYSHDLVDFWFQILS